MTRPYKITGFLSRELCEMVTPGALRMLHGSVQVTVTRFLGGDRREAVRMTLAAYLDLLPQYADRPNAPYLVDCPLKLFPDLHKLVLGVTGPLGDWRRIVPWSIRDRLSSDHGLGWLLIGAKGSRYALHQDLYGMHAWIMEFQGTKQIMLWPPDSDPHAAQPAVQVTLFPGEIAYIPSGWWHLTINQAPCVTVNVNFVNGSCVRRFLRELTVDLWREKVLRRRTDSYVNHDGPTL